MDNDKKLAEGLLKADGIDPAGATELERITFSKMLDRQLKSKESKPDFRFHIWSRIMKSRITRVAAAIIIVAVLTTLYRLTGSIDGATVAWADVIKNIQQIETFSCKAKVDSVGMELLGFPQKASLVLYNSREYGRRVDGYISKLITYSGYCIPDDGRIVGITIIPHLKKYLRKTAPADMIDPTVILDPQEFLPYYISFEHTALGQRRINGVVAEGIEVDDPMLYNNIFEEVTACLWVDVETNLPVLFETNCSADGGTIRQKQVIDEFKWSIPLGADLFKPDIPDDYTLLANIKVDNKSEDMAINGLRNYAKYTDGQYPSNMFLFTAWKEILQGWQASINWEQRPPTERERQQNQSIHSTCCFYAEFCKQGKDPAYYGNNVTADDTDAVLMRWKVLDDEYRVIFGDLSACNVTCEELAALENAPAFQDILQRPRQGIKVKGVIGMNLDNWPAITVMPDMPAEKMGLKNGDVVIGVNGKDVSHITKIPDALKVLIGPAGETLSLTVERNGQIIDFDIERVPLSK